MVRVAPGEAGPGSRRPPGGLSLDRSALAAGTRATLSRGGPRNADVLLVETSDGPVVVKDFEPRGRWVRRALGPWLSRREERAYRRLAGLRFVPAWLGRLDARAFVLEYRPGTYLSRSLAGRLPIGFMPELEAAVGEMHARGVVHLDLRHRSNVLADERGHPVVLDFASALVLDPTSRLGRLAVRWLGWLDRRALRKWAIRIGPGAVAPQEAASASGAGSAGSRGARRPM